MSSTPRAKLQGAGPRREIFSSFGLQAIKAASVRFSATDAATRASSAKAAQGDVPKSIPSTFAICFLFFIYFLFFSLLIISASLCDFDLGRTQESAVYCITFLDFLKNNP